MGNSAMLESWGTCADCDAIVSELGLLIRESHEITLPPELRKANDERCGDLRMWLTVHREEQGHKRRPARRDES